MAEIFIDTLLDLLKLIPFLFIAFLIIELLEHKLNNKSKKIIEKSNKFGPLFGSLLGIIPQCGFSVLATNLYITRIISLGTLISIYLSTSDEMLPILLAENASINEIGLILLLKVLIGMTAGFLINLFLTKESNNKKIDYSICDDEHCHCEKENIFLSSIKHTLTTLLFIAIITLILNIVMEYLGNDFISKMFFKNSIISPFLSGIIGLIPNCGSSIILTELYLNNIISFASVMSGLLANSGVALLVLLKSKINKKEIIKVFGILYIISVCSGLIIEIIQKIIY